jgi:hypothetical protein
VEREKMAIEGEGGKVPSVRVYIYNRKLKLSPPIHNVPTSTVWQPEDAAGRFFDEPRAYIYVPTSENGGTVYLAALLREMGLID